MIKCGLWEGVNKCEYFNKENSECKNPDKCSYQNFDINDVNPTEYVRKERWYEKYYKK